MNVSDIPTPLEVVRTSAYGDFLDKVASTGQGVLVVQIRANDIAQLYKLRFKMNERERVGYIEEKYVTGAHDLPAESFTSANFSKCVELSEGRLSSVIDVISEGPLEFDLPFDVVVFAIETFKTLDTWLNYREQKLRESIALADAGKT